MIEQYQGVSLKRIQHGQIARDIIIEGERAFPRHRAKPMLTSWAVRKRMIDELSERPEGFKRRSLARRLTKLDKALTDLEAYSLDRAFSAWLITAGKSKSVDVSGSGVRGNDQGEILSEQELREVGILRKALKGLPKQANSLILAIFGLMAPWHESKGADWPEGTIKAAVATARVLMRNYVDDFNKGA